MLGLKSIYFLIKFHPTWRHIHTSDLITAKKKRRRSSGTVTGITNVFFFCTQEIKDVSKYQHLDWFFQDLMGALQIVCEYEYKRRTTKCTKWPFLVIKLWFIIQILPSPWHNMWKCEENFYWTKKGLNSKFPKLMERHTMTLLVCQKVWQKCQQYFLNYSQQSCVMMSPLYHSLFCPNTENTLIEDIYFLLGLFLGLFP